MHRSTILFSLALGLLATRTFAHTDGVIEIHSSEPGRGALTVSGVPHDVVHANLVVCSGGQCLYENDESAVRAPSTNGHASGEYALVAGTPLRVEIVSIDPGASVKVGSADLDAAGKSTGLGKAHAVHAHPIWRIRAPQGQSSTWRIVLRFTTTASQYDDSDDVEIRVTNLEHGETTTTSSTSTTSPGPHCGNAVIEDLETCDHGGEPWFPGRACGDDCQWLACGDPDGDGETRATDALFVLSVAVGAHHCDDCLCNVDASATPAVSGADALRVLLYAVGTASEPLNCPPCDP
jgi:hypothetical protein